MTPVRNRIPVPMSTSIHNTTKVKLNHVPVEGRLSGNCTKKSGSVGASISGIITCKSGAPVVDTFTVVAELGTVVSEAGIVVPGASVVAGGKVVAGGNVVTGGRVVSGGKVVTGGNVVSGGNVVTGGSVVTGGNVVTTEIAEVFIARSKFPELQLSF